MKTEIEQLLLSYSSFGKPEAVELTQKVANDEILFSQLMTAFLASNMRVTQRAAWIISHCAEIKPELLLGYLKPMLQNLYNKPTDAVKRNTLRVFQFVELPEDCHEMAVDKCFQYLENRKEAVAIQVFAMSVIAKLIPYYPELKNDLQLILEDRLPTASAGYKSRAKKVLKQLEIIATD
ncbi:hypothetical protein C9994_09445 [Marivirga lumbricoides]|uniref:Adenylosuccinate lyase n=1 Tax=Marivirga lumbricoides TaxID=1046115 RepID=A0A2T4DQF5_9BACT|nr:hypothetical protein C9994_09445 [Marivirga lumbricoides]